MNLRIWLSSLFSLFFVLGSFNLYSQLPPPDGLKALRVVAIPKDNPADSIGSLEVSANTGTIAVGIYRPNNPPGKVIVLAKNNGQVANTYDYTEFLPPNPSNISGVKSIINGEVHEGSVLVYTNLLSYGREVAISADGNVLAVSAPTDNFQFTSDDGISIYDSHGLVFVYDLSGFNVGEDDPLDVPVQVFGSLSCTDGNACVLPGFTGQIQEFGRELHMNGEGAIVVASGRLGTLDSEKGAIVFGMNVNGEMQERDLIVLSNDPSDYTAIDGLGTDFSLSFDWPKTGSIVAGIPLFDQSPFSDAYNPGGGGIASLMAAPEIVGVGAQLSLAIRAPDTYNIPGNRFGNALESSYSGKEILALANGLNPPEVWHYRTDETPVDNFIPAFSRLNHDGNASNEFGHSLSLSPSGNVAVVGDPLLNRGVAYLYDIGSAVQGQDLDPVASTTPEELALCTGNFDWYLQFKGDEFLGNDERQCDRINLVVYSPDNPGDPGTTRFGEESGVNQAGTVYVLSADASFHNDPDLFANLSGDLIFAHLVMIFDADTFLPVELTSFTAEAEQGGVQLHWETATEQNNKGFHIERSHNAEDWQHIGWTDGNGNSLSPRRYSWFDEKPFNGINYYRLVQEDYDGRTNPSEVRSVHIDVSLEGLNVYPVPFRDALNVTTPTNMPVTMRIYDSSGQRQFEQLYPGGISELPLDNLAAGTYVLEIRNGNEVIHSQMVVKQ